MCEPIAGDITRIAVRASRLLRGQRPMLVARHSIGMVNCDGASVVVPYPVRSLVPEAEGPEFNGRQRRASEYLKLLGVRYPGQRVD